MGAPQLNNRYRDTDERTPPWPPQIPVNFDDGKAPVACSIADRFILSGIGARGTDKPSHGYIAMRLGKAGIFQPLSAEQARKLAANLARLADLMDDGRGKQ